MISKRFGLLLIAIGILIVFFSCKPSENGSPYEEISVPALSASDVDGEFEGEPVADKTEFEESLLSPLLGGLMKEENGGANSLVMSMVSPALPDTGTREVFLNENENIDKTIPLDNVVPFSSGSLYVKGSYKGYGKNEENGYGGALNLDGNLSADLSNAVIQVDSSNYTLSGKANAATLVDLDATTTGEDSNAVINVNLDYGVSFSIALLISDGSKGALVVMDLDISGRNYNNYKMSDYVDGDSAIMAILSDTIPEDASLNLSVYDNDSSLIFHESYGYKDLMALINEA